MEFFQKNKYYIANVHWFIEIFNYTGEFFIPNCTTHCIHF